MNAVEAVLVAELRLDLVSRVRPLSEQGWLMQRVAPNELVALDHQLTPIWRLELPAGRLGFVAVTDDRSLVAVSRDGQVVLLDGTGRQLAAVAGAHPQIGTGVFTADGAYLWVVLPGQGSEDPVTASQELWLIEVARFSIVDRRHIGMFVDDRRPIRHPDGHTVGLSLWVDRRPAIGWAVIEHGRIDLRLVPWRDRVLADVHPGGSEYLTVSRERSFVPGRDDELWRHRLRDDRLVGALAVSAATHLDDAWDARSGYLTNELILVSTLDTGWHLLIGTAPMGLFAEVAYPSPIAGSLPFPSGQGRWLTVGGGRVQGWVLPSPQESSSGSGCLDRMPQRSRLDGGGSWFEYLVARSIAYREARRRPGGARVATWAPSTAPRNWHGDYCGRPTATWRQGGGGSDVTDERRPPPNPPTDPNQEFRRALERETDLSLREDPERRRMYTSMDLPRSRSPSDEGSPPTWRHHRHDELTWNGEKLTLVGWSQRTGIRVEVLLRRCRRGWSVEEVLTTPLGEDRPGPYSSS